MIRTATSATVFHDAVGLRMSITYSEIDENSGTIISDNKRVDRVVTGAAKSSADAVLELAQGFIDSLEG